MYEWSITGKVIDVYDDPHLDIIRNGGMEKVASLEIVPIEKISEYPDHNFSLILEDEKGNIHRKFPVSDEDQVRMSLFYLEKTGNRLMPLARNTAAKNLTKVASAIGIDVPESIKEWSEKDTANKNFVGYKEALKHVKINYRPSLTKESMEKTAKSIVPEISRDGLSAACLARAHLINDIDIKEQLHKLASMAGKISSEDAIDILNTIDDAFDLKKYASKIGTPEQAVSMSLDRKETIKVGNQEVAVLDLRKLAGRQDLLEDIFNPGLRNEFMADPEEVFKSLDTNTKEFIVNELITKLE